MTKYKGRIASCAPVFGKLAQLIPALGFVYVVSGGTAAAQSCSWNNQFEPNRCYITISEEDVSEKNVYENDIFQFTFNTDGELNFLTPGPDDISSILDMRIAVPDIVLTSKEGFDLGGRLDLIGSSVAGGEGTTVVDWNGDISEVVLQTTSQSGDFDLSFRSSNEVFILGFNSDFWNNYKVTSTGAINEDLTNDRGVSIDRMFGGSFQFDVNDVYGTEAGFWIVGRGDQSTEDFELVSRGTVEGGDYGIRIAELNNPSNLTMDVNNVRGDENAIYLNNRLESKTIQTSGEISSVNGAAIYVDSTRGDLTLDLQNGTVLSPASGVAIEILGGASNHLLLRSGSELAGDVILSDAVNTLTIEGGADYSGVGSFDGDANDEDTDVGANDDDTLIFSNYTGGYQASKFYGWDHLRVVGGNLTVNASDFGDFSGGTIEISNGATIAAQADSMSGFSDFYIDSVLALENSSQFVSGGAAQIDFEGSVLNNGLISFADDKAGDLMLVSGTLTGSGTIELDVDLTNGTNDEVQILGDTSGIQHGLRLNTIGSGGGTNQEYILVTVAGNSTETDFRLVDADFVTNDGAQAIDDGDIIYRLQHNEAAGTFVLTPLIRAGSSVAMSNPAGDIFAASVQQASQAMRFSSPLRRVMGPIQNGLSEANTVSRALYNVTKADRPVVILRIEGQRNKYSVDQREVDTNTGGMRFGAALPLAEFASGNFVGGVEFGVSRLSTNVATPLTSADIRTDAYDVTLSGLWISHDQFYVDSQFRYAYFSGSTTPNGGHSVDTDSQGFGIALEIGKPYERQNGLSLIPQAQFMYSNIDADNVVDLAGSGQTGMLSDGDTLTARFGLRAEKTLANQSVLYSQIDYFHAFDDTTSVRFGSNTVLTEIGKHSAAVSLGGNISLSDRTILFGKINGETGLGSHSSDYSFGGNIGVEITF